MAKWDLIAPQHCGVTLTLTLALLLLPVAPRDTGTHCSRCLCRPLSVDTMAAILHCVSVLRSQCSGSHKVNAPASHLQILHHPPSWMVLEIAPIDHRPLSHTDCSPCLILVNVSFFSTTQRPDGAPTPSDLSLGPHSSPSIVPEKKKDLGWLYLT